MILTSEAALREVVPVPPARAWEKESDHLNEDAAAFVRDGIDAAVATVSVGARVSAPADDVRQLIGRWAKVEPDGGGRCRVTMAAENLDWAVFALGVTGAAIDDVHPPELLEHLRAWGARFGTATARG